MADPQTQRAKLDIPIEALDALMPTGPLTPTTPMAPPARPTFTRTAAPPAGPAPAVPATGGSPAGALPPIASPPPAASLPPPIGSHLQAVSDAPQKSTLQKIGGTLGRIGGVALSALAPGVAQFIPSTPLGKISAQNRELRQGEVTAREGRETAQATQATAAAGRDTAEAAKATQETENLKAGGWKDVGQPVVDDAGNIHVVQQNQRGETRLAPVDVSGGGAGGGVAGPAASAAPATSGIPGAAPTGAPAPAATGAGPTFTKLGTPPKEADEPFGDPAQANAEFLDRYKVLNPGATKLPPEYTLPANAKVKDYARINDQLKSTENAQLAKSSKDTAQETQKLNRTLAQQRADEKKQNDLNREVDKARTEMEKDISPIDEKLENLNEAMGMLERPNAMKDALVVVKSLVASAGGKGSGVRITMPEINRLAEARGIQGSGEVFINKALSLIDDNKYETLSSNQRQQLSGLLGDIRDRIQQKRDMAGDALNTITNATDVKQIRQAQTDLNKKVQDFNKAGPSGGGEKSVKIGGQDVKVGKDGIFEYNGQKYKVNAEGTGGTLVTSGGGNTGTK